MSPAEILRRVAALLVATGLLVAFAAGISADEGDEKAAARAALQPTQMVAEIPEGYNELFELQWGGGSLYQLKGRLATMGCMADVIWVRHNNQWQPYSQYSVPQDFYINQQFVQQYEQFIPAGTAWADCYDTPVIPPTTPLPILVQPADLKLTEIVADIPTEYDTTFSLQWGGGSLLHLKGRLATMGCIVNNISFIDPNTNREHTYNQYNTRSTDRTNQQFVQQYEQFIPAGTAWADCYNVCEFGGEQCLTFDELREQENNFDEYFEVLRRQKTANFIIDENTTCTRDFHPVVQEQVLPTLPTRPDTCIVRKEDTTGAGRGSVGAFVWYDSVNAPPFFIMNDTMHPKHRGGAEHKSFLLLIETHEMCHMNQTYQQVQGLTTEQGFNEDDHTWFKNTPQGKEFIEMVGYIDKGYYLWALPKNSIYRDIYSNNPIELSAELCAMYLLDRIGATQRYEYERWVVSSDSWGYFEPFSPLPNFNVNTYLTPQIRQWLETYMILPEITEGTE